MRKKREATGDDRKTEDMPAVGGAGGGADAVPAGVPDINRDQIWGYFPMAHPLPYPEIGCIQIVTGTGYVLGWAKTEAGAWKESLRLIRAMDEDAMRRIIRDVQPAQELAMA